MNLLLLRIGALAIHALLNFILISWLTNFDITGSWLTMAGFLLILFILLVLFIKHMFSFITYIKSATK